MNEYSNIDIDYEHMDDLPLSDRIEWNHIQFEKVKSDDFGYDLLEWQAV